MSIEAMSWAMWQQEVTDPVARHVLLILANYAGEDGKSAFCSVETMVLMTGLGERTIRRKLDDLVLAGVAREGRREVAAVHIGRADRIPKVYDLALADVPKGRVAVLGARDSRGAAVAPREEERGAGQSPTGCRSDNDGVPDSQLRGAGAAPDTPNDPSIEPLNEKKASAAPKPSKVKPEAPWIAEAKAVALPAWLPQGEWDSFVEHRALVKTPLSVRACELAVAKLERMREAGMDPIASIQQTVLSGKWTDLYDPKGKAGDNATPREQRARDRTREFSGGLVVDGGQQSPVIVTMPRAIEGGSHALPS